MCVMCDDYYDINVCVIKLILMCMNVCVMCNVM